jgi:hypothetical protein
MIHSLACQRVSRPQSRAFCYYRRNDLSAALKNLEAAVGMAPDDQQAAVFLGRAYASSGRPQEGIRVL